MIQAVRVDLAADRWIQFGYDIDITGVDLTDAPIHAQVRLYPNAAGDPLIDMPLVTNLDNGIKLVGVDTTGPLPVSHLRMQISAITMANMPAGAEVGDDTALAWDMIINDARWFFGTFTVRAGVTRNG